MPRVFLRLFLHERVCDELQEQAVSLRTDGPKRGQ
jgi:hypothetical protein